MRARVVTAIIAVGLALASSGCRPQTMYYWGGYDDALYRHYRNPQDRVAYVEALQTIIAQADQQGLRVPPGVCAEYGYALYEEGRPQEAVPWFQRERDHWPESRILMEKMIRNAQQRVGTAAGPAAAVPAAAQPGPGAPEKTP
jgi:hypothetical protein